MSGMNLTFSTDLESFILHVREQAVASRAREPLIAKLDEILELQACVEELAEFKRYDHLSENLYDALKSLLEKRNSLTEAAATEALAEWEDRELVTTEEPEGKK